MCVLLDLTLHIIGIHLFDLFDIIFVNCVCFHISRVQAVYTHRLFCIWRVHSCLQSDNSILVIGMISSSMSADNQFIDTKVSDAQIRDQTRIDWLRSRYCTVFSLSPGPANPPDKNFHVSSRCVVNGAKDLVKLMNTSQHADKRIDTICIEYVRMEKGYYENIIAGRTKKAGKSLIDFIRYLQRYKKLTEYCTLCFARYPNIGERWFSLLTEFQAKLNCEIDYVTSNKNPLFRAGEETSRMAFLKCKISDINYTKKLEDLVKPYKGDEPFCRITIKPDTAVVVKALNQSKTKVMQVEQKKEKEAKRTCKAAAIESASKTKKEKRKKRHEHSNTRSAKRRRSVIRHRVRRRKRGLTCCACGDTFCNAVSKFLGPPVVNRRLCYKRPAEFKDKRVTYSHENKFKRAQIIHSQMIEWRKKFNNKWPLATSARFNEIHYPRKFLHEVGECTRLPMTIKISLAKQVGMFSNEHIVYNPRLKLRSVLVVPCLTATQAMQDVINSRHSTAIEYVSECVCFTCRRTSPHAVAEFGECPPQRCLQPYHNAVVERNVFVRPSRIHNYGLFARKRMVKGDIICLYSGSLHEKTASLTNTNRYFCEVEQNKKTYVIDSDNVLNYSGRWCNHSLFPNASLIVPLGGMLKLRTGQYAILVECERTINEKEEIFINYGRSYFTGENENDIEAAYFTITRPDRNSAQTTEGYYPILRISWQE